MISALSDLEVWAEAALLEHQGNIATHRNRFASLEGGAKVKSQRLLFRGDGTFIGCFLTVVLVAILEVINLIGTNSDRVEFDIADKLGQTIILACDLELLRSDNVLEADISHESPEIFIVKSARDAFSPENLVLLEYLRDTSVGVHVAEEELASWFQNSVDFRESNPFIGH